MSQNVAVEINFPLALAPGTLVAAAERAGLSRRTAAWSISG
ncbi:MAG: hypothetical protein ACJ8F7_22055 [Gemmataceae bacterium]